MRYSTNVKHHQSEANIRSKPEVLHLANKQIFPRIPSIINHHKQHQNYPVVDSFPHENHNTLVPHSYHRIPNMITHSLGKTTTENMLKNIRRKPKSFGDHTGQLLEINIDDDFKVPGIEKPSFNQGTPSLTRIKSHVIRKPIQIKSHIIPKSKYSQMMEQKVKSKSVIQVKSHVKPFGTMKRRRENQTRYQTKYQMKNSTKKPVKDSVLMFLRKVQLLKRKENKLNNPTAKTSTTTKPVMNRVAKFMRKLEILKEKKKKSNITTMPVQQSREIEVKEMDRYEKQALNIYSHIIPLHYFDFEF